MEHLDVKDTVEKSNKIQEKSLCLFVLYLRRHVANHVSVSLCTTVNTSIIFIGSYLLIFKE